MTKTRNDAIANLSVLFCMIYIFMWENILIHSGIVFMLIGVTSILNLIIKRKVILNVSAIALITVALINLVGLIYLKGEFEDASDWILRIVIIFLLFLSLSNSTFSIKWLVVVFAVVSLLFSIGVLLDYLNIGIVDTINSMILKEESVSNHLVMRTWGFYSGFSGYNIVSAVMAMMLFFIALAIYYNTDKGKFKVISITVAVLLLIIIIMTQKRGIFVAAMFALVYSIWHEKLTKLNIIKQITFFASFILAFILVYYFLQSSPAGQLFLNRFNNTDDISTGRFDIAKTLLSNWSDYFILGNGPAATKAIFSMNAHNIYIQIFYENGIIGLVVYLVFFISNLKNAYQQFANRAEAPFQYKIFITISLLVQIGFLIYGLFGNPMQDLFIFLIYILFAGLPYSVFFRTGNISKL